MLDIKFIRESGAKLREAIINKNGNPENLDKILSMDQQRRKLIVETEALRSRRNEITAKLQAGPDDALIQESKQIKEKLSVLETELANLEEDWNKALAQIPNPALPNVPVGSDETANKVLRQIGKPPKFSFEPKDHLALGESLDMIDTTRAVKVSGARFAYLKGHGALLELALVQFALRHLMAKGFVPVFPPALIKQDITSGLGYWQAGGNENYYLVEDFERQDKGEEQRNPLYLVGTGEHSVVPMHKDEVLPDSLMPRKYAAFSSCFRREAGSYGRDTKGILRVHQFDKVEMVAFVRPEDDEATRSEMLATVEDMLKELELPYQVVALCTGDISFPSAETIDIETWVPSQNKYRETHSISTTTDFQARRLNIKYQGKSGREFVHILNGTAFAIGRMIIAIMENYQQADGSIKVPKVLQEFMGTDVIKK